MVRNHPNKAKSGLWLPEAGDLHDPVILKAYKAFFEDDLKRAEADLKDQLKLANPKLTPSKKNVKTMGQEAKAAIKVSKLNILMVNHLLGI